LSVEQPFFRRVLPASRKAGGLVRLALTQFLHANLVGLAAQHSPIHIANPRAEFGMAAMLAYGYEVALFKGRNQFARVSPIAVFFNGHSPDSFGQCCHHGFVFNPRSDRCAR
jgi:hypothetical protein